MTRLIVLPSLQAMKGPGGGVVLTRKFVEGMRRYVEHWPGPVSVLIEPAEHPDENLDQQEWRDDELPFEVQCVSFRDRAAMDASMRSARLVAAGLDHHQTHLAPWARRAGARIVYTSEYTLRTRVQIAQAEDPPPWVLARRALWASRQELRYLRAVRQADGLQCNGTPTYDAYRRIQRNTLLFFDTRTRADMLATDDEVREKGAHVETGAPLRLGFSGRLNRMKGADRLLDVAEELDRRAVPYTLDIWGGGVLVDQMNARIRARDLGARVRMRGTVEFESELVPAIKRSIDLYVMCHRQGDPSCTYLETLACGVPIVGFGNEAWTGLAKRGRFGWVAGMDDIRGVADHIERLQRSRAELAAAMTRALAFAREHTFERTFATRLAHLRDTAGL